MPLMKTGIFTGLFDLTILLLPNLKELLDLSILILPLSLSLKTVFVQPESTIAMIKASATEESFVSSKNTISLVSYGQILHLSRRLSPNETFSHRFYIY